MNVPEREFTVKVRKQWTSCISVLTGLNHKVAARLQKLSTVETSDLNERYNRAARKIAGWLHDDYFLDNKGDPDIVPPPSRRVVYK